ncbi:hypothetical protein HDU81_005459 [Chytriomyces hyalinus]|nr:hypothetical protein HDU81_005459 [Chytriomyces hyalinus]
MEAESQSRRDTLRRAVLVRRTLSQSGNRKSRSEDCVIVNKVSFTPYSLSNDGKVVSQTADCLFSRSAEFKDVQEPGPRNESIESCYTPVQIYDRPQRSFKSEPQLQRHSDSSSFESLILSDPSKSAPSILASQIPHQPEELPIQDVPAELSSSLITIRSNMSSRASLRKRPGSAASKLATKQMKQKQQHNQKSKANTNLNQRPPSNMRQVASHDPQEPETNIISAFSDDEIPPVQLQGPTVTAEVSPQIHLDEPIIPTPLKIPSLLERNRRVKSAKIDRTPLLSSHTRPVIQRNEAVVSILAECATKRTFDWRVPELPSTNTIQPTVTTLPAVVSLNQQHQFLRQRDQNPIGSGDEGTTKVRSEGTYLAHNLIWPRRLVRPGHNISQEPAVDFCAEEPPEITPSFQKLKDAFKICDSLNGPQWQRRQMQQGLPVHYHQSEVKGVSMPLEVNEKGIASVEKSEEFENKHLSQQYESQPIELSNEIVPDLLESLWGRKCPRSSTDFTPVAWMDSNENQDSAAFDSVDLELYQQGRPVCSVEEYREEQFRSSKSQLQEWTQFADTDQVICIPQIDPVLSHEDLYTQVEPVPSHAELHSASESFKSSTLMPATNYDTENTLFFGMEDAFDSQSVGTRSLKDNHRSNVHHFDKGYKTEQEFGEQKELRLKSEINSHIKRVSSARHRPATRLGTMDPGAGLPEDALKNPSLMRCGNSRPRSAYLLNLEERWRVSRNPRTGVAVSNRKTRSAATAKLNNCFDETVLRVKEDGFQARATMASIVIPKVWTLDKVMRMYETGESANQVSLDQYGRMARPQTRGQSARYSGRNTFEMSAISVSEGDTPAEAIDSKPNFLVARSQGWNSEFGDDCECDNNEMTVLEQDLGVFSKHVTEATSANSNTQGYIKIVPNQRQKVVSDCFAPTNECSATSAVRITQQPMSQRESELERHLNSMLFINFENVKTFAAETAESQNYNEDALDPVTIPKTKLKKKRKKVEKNASLEQQPVDDTLSSETQAHPLEPTEPETESDDSDSDSIDISFTKEEQDQSAATATEGIAVPYWVDVALIAFLILEKNAVCIQRRWRIYRQVLKASHMLNTVVYLQRFYRAYRVRVQYLKLQSTRKFKRNAILSAQKKFNEVDAAAEIYLSGECQRAHRNAFAKVVDEHSAYLSMQKRAQERADRFAGPSGNCLSNNLLLQEGLLSASTDSVADTHDDKSALNPVRARFRNRYRKRVAGLESQQGPDRWQKVCYIMSCISDKYNSWYQREQHLTLDALTSRMDMYVTQLRKGFKRTTAIPIKNQLLEKGASATITSSVRLFDNQAATQNSVDSIGEKISRPSLQHLIGSLTGQGSEGLLKAIKAEENEAHGSTVSFATSAQKLEQTPHERAFDIGQTDEPLNFEFVRNPLSDSSSKPIASSETDFTAKKRTLVKFSDSVPATQQPSAFKFNRYSLPARMTTNAKPNELEDAITVRRSSMTKRSLPSMSSMESSSSSAFFAVPQPVVAVKKAKSSTTKKMTAKSETLSLQSLQTSLPILPKSEVKVEKRPQKRESKMRRKKTMALREARILSGLQALCVHVSVDGILSLISRSDEEKKLRHKD